MKAYTISCEDDDHGNAVTFAETLAKADKRANSEHCDCEYIDRKAHRSPQFDKYYPGPVTVGQCIEEGWYYPCAKCGHSLGRDDGPLIADNGFCFCDEKCLAELTSEYEELGPGAHSSIPMALKYMRKLNGEIQKSKV